MCRLGAVTSQAVDIMQMLLQAQQNVELLAKDLSVAMNVGRIRFRKLRPTFFSITTAGSALRTVVGSCSYRLGLAWFFERWPSATFSQ